MRIRRVRSLAVGLASGFACAGLVAACTHVASHTTTELRSSGHTDPTSSSREAASGANGGEPAKFDAWVYPFGDLTVSYDSVASASKALQFAPLTLSGASATSLVATTRDGSSLALIYPDPSVGKIRVTESVADAMSNLKDFLAATKGDTGVEVLHSPSTNAVIGAVYRYSPLGWEVLSERNGVSILIEASQAGQPPSQDLAALLSRVGP